MTTEIQDLKKYYLSYQELDPNNKDTKISEDDRDSTRDQKELFFCSSRGLKSLRSLIGHYRGPSYVYDLDLIGDRIDLMKTHLNEVQIYYAMKANCNDEILKFVLKKGLGADVVSLGEIHKAIEIGFSPENIIFSGVGKTKVELEKAIDLEIDQINVESLPELERIIKISKKKGKSANVAFRLNPDISIETHPYIATGLRDNKFGIDLAAFGELLDLCNNHKSYLNIRGVSLHLGSQMMDFNPLKESLAKIESFFLKLNSLFPECHRFDVGGGLGVFYQKQDLIHEKELLIQYAAVIFEELKGLKTKIKNFQIQTEPGRWLVAHSGVLISQVQYVKKTPYKNFLVLDTGMNHLLRPSLYEAYHEIFPLIQRTNSQEVVYDVVGPICESSDFIAKDRRLQELAQDDFVIIADCGAYGSSMSNDYNLQPRAEEKVLQFQK